MVTLGFVSLGVLNYRVEGANTACQIVKTGRGNKFLMQTYELSRLMVGNAELKVDNSLAWDIKIVSHKLCETGPVLLLNLEAIVFNGLNFFSKK